MRKLILLLLVLFMVSLYSQDKILDTGNIWEALGFPRDYEVVTMDGATDEDAMFNMYYHPKNLYDDITLHKIEAELPYGKEGAFRLTALLFFRIAENPDLKKQKEKRIISFLNYLKENKYDTLFDPDTDEYKIIGGFTITFAEAKSYYERALKNKLNEFEIKFVSDKDKEAFKSIVYKYFSDPNDTNYKTIVEYIRNYYKTDLIGFSLRIVYLNEISSKFANRLISSMLGIKQ